MSLKHCAKHATDRLEEEGLKVETQRGGGEVNFFQGDMKRSLEELHNALRTALWEQVEPVWGGGTEGRRERGKEISICGGEIVWDLRREQLDCGDVVVVVVGGGGVFLVVTSDVSIMISGVHAA